MAYLVYPNELQTHLEQGSYHPRQMVYPETSASRMSQPPDQLTNSGHMYPTSYPASALQETSGYSVQGVKHSESLKAPSTLGQHYFVDRMMKPHPYSTIYPGLDLNAIRRKNASRETTGPLKAWLRDHRKNPYPTKGEKVMLAIATRMTLTQVSTWFANARRRMKKDKIDDDEEEEEKADLSSGDITARCDRSDSIASRLSLSGSEADTSKDLSDVSDIDDTSFRARQSRKCVQRLFFPDAREGHVLSSTSPGSVYSDNSNSQESLLRVADNLEETEEIDVLTDDEPVTKETKTEKSTSEKPRIWSISEIIGSSSSTAPSVTNQSYDRYSSNIDISSSFYTNPLTTHDSCSSSIDMSSFYTNPLTNFSQYFGMYPAHL